MSEKWIDVQSFLSDQDVLLAINDLSIAIKQELAGVVRKQRAEKAKEAQKKLRKFLLRLNHAVLLGNQDSLLGVDPRFRQLVEDFEASRNDTANFRSRLMRDGPGSVIHLLDSIDVVSRNVLLESLSELRRVVARHQQTDAAAILEDF